MGKQDFGGRIIFRLSTIGVLPLRGTFNVDPADQSSEAVVNQDKSVDRTATNVAPGCEISLADRGIDYNALMKSDRFNVTAIEEFTGVTHYWTKAFVVGKPTKNRMNGEVTGLSISAESYTRTDG